MDKSKYLESRFTKTIREKVKYPNLDGEYGEWDCLNFEQRKFLIELAEYLDCMEKIVLGEKDVTVND